MKFQIRILIRLPFQDLIWWDDLIWNTPHFLNPLPLNLQIFRRVHLPTKHSDSWNTSLISHPIIIDIWRKSNKCEQKAKIPLIRFQELMKCNPLLTFVLLERRTISTHSANSPESVKQRNYKSIYSCGMNFYRVSKQLRRFYIFFLTLIVHPIGPKSYWPDTPPYIANDWS